MGDYRTLTHNFEPVYDSNSKVLILGTFPSVKSREMNFYYGHPQNRFWKVIAQITESKLPQTIEEKKKLLLDNHIAVWDVIKMCDIVGSSDSSIKNVIPNDITELLAKTEIEFVIANGATAKKLYDKYALPKTNKEAVKLPSTSPANAACNMDKLCMEWGKILDKYMNGANI